MPNKRRGVYPKYIGGDIIEEIVGHWFSLISVSLSYVKEVEFLEYVKQFSYYYNHTLPLPLHLSLELKVSPKWSFWRRIAGKII